MTRDRAPCRLSSAFVLAVAATSTAAAGGQDAPIRPDDPATLVPGIRAAARAGKTKVVVPPGVYRVAPPPGGGRFHVELADLADFEVDARGATFLWQDPGKGGIAFSRCRNVTLRGATLQHQTPPFTQGAVVAVAADRASYDFRVDAGYPADFDDPRSFPADPTGYVFDPATRQWKAGTHDHTCRRVERLGEGLFRLHWGRPLTGEPVVAGDLLAFRGRGVTDVHLGDCAGMNVEGVTIRHGGGFCVHEDGGEGGSRYAFAVTYGPRPRGATADPLIACNADAFHSSGTRVGPRLEGCAFEGMPDDGVAVHGYYAHVDHAEGDTLTVGWFHDRLFFRPGDPLRLYDHRGAPAGESTVRAVRKLDGFRPERATTHRSFRDRRLVYFALTLSSTLPASFDGLAADPAANGSGYVVRDCTVRNHRARGLLLKADRGLVEHNTIDGSTIAGIVLAPELWWNEADFSRQVVIRGNTIRHTGYATTGPWTDQAGGLTITGEGGPGHADVRVVGNTFRDVCGVNLQVDHARDVTVVDNRFLGTHKTPCRNGADRGVDPGAVVWLNACRGVTLKGNTVAVGLGPHGTRAVVATPTAVGVTGLSDGVTIAP